MEDSSCTQVQSPATNVMPTDVVPPLTDAALTAGGMEKITAYVRTAQSSNALRKQRSREKAQKQGLKQLNIQLPIDMHPVVKAIAQELQKAGDVATALQEVLASLPRTETGDNGIVLKQPTNPPWWRWIVAMLFKQWRR